MQRLSANSPVTYIKTVGDHYASLLEKLGIVSIKDLLFHIPSKYQDTSNISTVENFLNKGDGTFLCELKNIKTVYTRNHKVFTKATAFDDTAKVEILWFNQSYLEKALKEKTKYILDGKLTIKNNKKILYSPKYEIFKGKTDKQVHLGKLTTVYPETKGVSSKWIRSKIAVVKRNISKLIKDPLYKDILEKEKLLPLNEAIEEIHFPKDIQDIEEARKRLAFDEMLSIAFRIEEEVEENKKKKAYKQEIAEKDLDKFINTLPYKLTKDQRKAYKEIFNDLQKDIPMNRLLNGDVGSGKTIVAAIAILNTILNNKSAVLMAPTTVLAQQHYDTFSKLFRKLKVPIELCASENKKISEAENRLIIGTHAVLYKQQLPDIGLLIIDEQHRFGVSQRRKLLDTNSEYSPHLLSMTATPIPRSLTKSIYGEIDISVIKEMPKNRIPIQTFYTPYKKRLDCFKWIADKVKNNNDQAFLVYPLIEESYKITARSVTQEFEELNEGIFKDLKLGFLHGRMKDIEKNKILGDFRKKKYNILISTSVIEVGLDIPNATIMVIENAERFGLAQLHQLRGRVGRGEKQSYCFVIPGGESSDEALDRLKYFAKHNSGFDVAEYDLQRRGPGEVYGLRQSGIPQFKVARLNDFELLNSARKVAKEILKKDNCDIEKIKKGLFR
jgi:ATP-dependent DNA helicase RecG